ncbi:MAG: 50S ribosomal protein L15 [Deltaproteobacteria bacterium]|nr:50S ribosomal protein L15 [Deltaproteobacteria bacterium]
MSTEKAIVIQGLHNLVAPWGQRQAKKRLGRGRASGLGKTCGRGHKGQKKTASGQVRPGFEGGQLPMSRRLPKRGFRNHEFRVDYATVNVGRLAERFQAGALVDPASLVACGLVTKPRMKIKLLGTGEIPMKLNVKVHAISAGARAKIEANGGTVEVLVPAKVLDAAKTSA